MIFSQTESGKAFEYALLLEFFERLKSLTSVSIAKNELYPTQKDALTVLLTTNKTFLELPQVQQLIF